MFERSWFPFAMVSLLLLALGGTARMSAQQSGQVPGGAGAGQQRGPGGRGGREPAVFPPLFFEEDFQRPHNPQGQVPVLPENISNPNLELHVYGLDAKSGDLMHTLTISGMAGSDTMPINLWTGLCMNPVAATFRDKNHYVDLSGLAKVRWVTRASGYHVVRPVIKLGDGTLLVGDHVDANTTTFLVSEITFTGTRWIRLDPDRVVTTGAYGPAGEASAWVSNPDLSKVDEVGFADLMPGSGHGSGGWINVARVEVYGKPVPRTATSATGSATP